MSEHPLLLLGGERFNRNSHLLEYLVQHLTLRCSRITCCLLLAFGKYLLSIQRPCSGILCIMGAGKKGNRLEAP